jgi:hypothetical protein
LAQLAVAKRNFTGLQGKHRGLRAAFAQRDNDLSCDWRSSPTAVITSLFTVRNAVLRCLNGFPTSATCPVAHLTILTVISTW